MDSTYRPDNFKYKTIAILNENHGIFLVQDQTNSRIYVKKVLDVYNLDIYKRLSTTSIVGIPRILEYYEHNNQLTIIEDYISGIPLQDKLKEHISYIDALKYLYDLCSILKKLHSLNPPIIHRDIKPSNIIITNYNKAVLLDFNAAKTFSPASTEDTRLLGTQGYAAPEQYGFGSSSPQTDIYSLGIVLKEMLSLCSNYPKELDTIVSKCTQMNPSERYNNVQDLAHSIRAYINPANDKPEKNEVPTSFLPPGFRSHTPWKMLIATPIYALILWLCFTLEVKNVNGLALWVERIFCLAMFLSIIFGCFNYRNVHQYFPLCQHNNRLVRYLGIVLFDAAIVFALLLAMIIIEIVFFHVV